MKENIKNVIAVWIVTIGIGLLAVYFVRLKEPKPKPNNQAATSVSGKSTKNNPQRPHRSPQISQHSLDSTRSEEGEYEKAQKGGFANTVESGMVSAFKTGGSRGVISFMQSLPPGRFTTIAIERGLQRISWEHGVVVNKPQVIEIAKWYLDSDLGTKEEINNSVSGLIIGHMGWDKKGALDLLLALSEKLPDSDSDLAILKRKFDETGDSQYFSDAIAHYFLN